MNLYHSICYEYTPTLHKLTLPDVSITFSTHPTTAALIKSATDHSLYDTHILHTHHLESQRKMSKSNEKQLPLQHVSISMTSTGSSPNAVNKQNWTKITYRLRSKKDKKSSTLTVNYTKNLNQNIDHLNKFNEKTQSNKIPSSTRSPLRGTQCPHQKQKTTMPIAAIITPVQNLTALSTTEITPHIYHNVTKQNWTKFQGPRKHLYPQCPQLSPLRKILPSDCNEVQL